LAGHIACVIETTYSYNIFVNVKGRDHFEDLGIDGNIILEWI